MVELIVILEILKWIGIIAGAILSVVTLSTLLLKKPKKWLTQITKDANADNFTKIDKEFQKIHDFNEKSEHSDICILRHEITLIYENYREKKEIPSRMRENLCSLYEDYSSRGGNSYVKQIYNEMLTWKVI